MTESNRDKIDKYIVLFDGVCNFCNSAVNFIIDRDKLGKFAFASLQSEIGTEIIKRYGVTVHHKDMDSIILVKNNQLSTKSTAALEIARELDGGWPLFYAFIIVPSFIRDFFYDLLAKYRYKLFGKSEICHIPTSDIRNRFLEFVKK